jgi:hypothetical protein
MSADETTPSSPLAAAAPRASLASRLRLVSIVMVGTVAGLAALVLGAWLLDAPAITGGGTRPITMTVGTAFVLLTASLAVGVQFREGVALSPSRLLLISTGATVLLVSW